MTARFRWKGDAMAWLWRKNSEEWNGMFSFFRDAFFAYKTNQNADQMKKI
jgi:hypothetical protein